LLQVSAVVGCAVALMLKGALGSKKLKDAQIEAEKIVTNGKGRSRQPDQGGGH
jgi:hypothetical protein